MLNASELYEEAAHKFGDMGIKVGSPSVDLAAMLKYKDKGVDGNVKGVDYLFKKNKIETFLGTGRITAPGKVELKAVDGKTQTLETKAIVIATGSDVARLPGIAIDESVSCRRPARWNSPACRKSSSSSAPASSGSSSARCGGGSAPR